MAQRVRRIGVMPFATTMAALYLLLGVIILIPIMLFGGALSKMTGGMSGSGGFSMGVMIAMPIIYGICGFILGAITAALYNVVAGWTGGIEIELA
jgi:hypothetical protein